MQQYRVIEFAERGLQGGNWRNLLSVHINYHMPTDDTTLITNTLYDALKQLIAAEKGSVRLIDIGPQGYVVDYQLPQVSAPDGTLQAAERAFQRVLVTPHGCVTVTLTTRDIDLSEAQRNGIVQELKALTPPTQRA